MYTEMDVQVGRLVDALKLRGMWGRRCSHLSPTMAALSTTPPTIPSGEGNTFYEGGVRVTAFISGPLVPPSRRGADWWGLSASADWYHTLVEGSRRQRCPPTRGPAARQLQPVGRHPGGRGGTAHRVVHQVHNQTTATGATPAPAQRRYASAR